MLKHNHFKKIVKIYLLKQEYLKLSTVSCKKNVRIVFKFFLFISYLLLYCEIITDIISYGHYDLYYVHVIIRFIMLYYHYVT